MRKISTTAFLGVIALTITACGSSDNQQSASPSPSTPPVATNPSPVKPTTPPPVIAQNPSGTVYLAPSLIQPTNANQRVKQVAKGRRDPFAALFAPVSTPIPVSVAPPNSPTAPASTGSSASAPNRQQTSSGNNASRRQPNSSVAARNSGATNNRRNSNPTKVSVGTPSPATTPNTSAVIPPPPSSLPGNNLPPAPPEQLAPELAQNVTVMGVIQIGETTQAIVQVPNEATSRYVQVGQRLSNGQVLVKRIEMNEGAEPLVVLEQYGVEVAKAVGEEPANQNQQTSPTAALPSSAGQNITTQAAIPTSVPKNIPTRQAVAIPSPPVQNITTSADVLAVPSLPPNTPANNGVSNPAN